jgi:hypothetical protein
MIDGGCRPRGRATQRWPKPEILVTHNAQRHALRVAGVHHEPVTEKFKLRHYRWAILDRDAALKFIAYGLIISPVALCALYALIGDA